MGNINGRNINKPVEICMMVGCDAKALYRSVSSSGIKRGRRTERGYCAKHKALALAGAKAENARREQWYDRKEYKD